MQKFLISLGLIILAMFAIAFAVEDCEADSLNITAGVGSKHFLPYDLNEKNGGIGIGYQYDVNDVVSINADYLRFTNSYFRETNFYGLTGSYSPISYGDYKLGIFGGVVHNDGYCKFYDYCTKDEDTTDFLPIGGLMIQLDNLVIKGMALPNVDTSKIDAVVWLIQFRAMEWGDARKFLRENGE